MLQQNKLDEDGKRSVNVSQEQPYNEVEFRVRDEIANHFKFRLNRPEILNRIGENIVVFDFIRPEVAALIYEKVRDNALRNLLEKQKISVTLSEEANATLQRKCTEDLSNGGRGIGNQLEAWLVNPLARALFDSDVLEGGSTTVTEVREMNEVPEVVLA